MPQVGSYEAKTHLPRLLERVARGERITITKHGVPVAVLVPPDARRKGSPEDAIRNMRRFRRGRKSGGNAIRRMIEEGRR